MQKLPTNKLRTNVNADWRESPPLIRTPIHNRLSMDPTIPSDVGNIWCRERFPNHSRTVVVSTVALNIIHVLVRSLHPCGQS
jgi:hypothetical protein